MAKVKTDDLPVDEALSEGEMKRAQGGALSGFPSYAQSGTWAQEFHKQVARGLSDIAKERQLTASQVQQLINSRMRS